MYYVCVKCREFSLYFTRGCPRLHGMPFVSVHVKSHDIAVYACLNVFRNYESRPNMRSEQLTRRRREDIHNILQNKMAKNP